MIPLGSNIPPAPPEGWERGTSESHCTKRKRRELNIIKRRGEVKRTEPQNRCGSLDLLLIC